MQWFTRERTLPFQQASPDTSQMVQVTCAQSRILLQLGPLPALQRNGTHEHPISPDSRHLLETSEKSSGCLQSPKTKAA